MTENNINKRKRTLLLKICEKNKDQHEVFGKAQNEPWKIVRCNLTSDLESQKIKLDDLS